MPGIDDVDSTVLIISAEVPVLGQKLESSFKVRLGKEGDSNAFELVSTILEELSQDQSTFLSPEELQTGQAKFSGFKEYALNALDEWHAKLKNAQEGMMKVERAKEEMNRMRTTYFKELQLLREMVYRKSEMERQGKEFIPDEVRNFDPTDYQFDTSVAEMVKQKIEMMQMKFAERIAEVTRSCAERVGDLTVRLNNVRLHLDKKDDLLRSLMQKHNYTNEAELVKALAETADPSPPASPRRPIAAGTRWRRTLATVRVATQGARTGGGRRNPKVEAELLSPPDSPRISATKSGAWPGRQDSPGSPRMSATKSGAAEQPAWRGGGIGGGRFFAAVSNVQRSLRRIGSSNVVDNDVRKERRTMKRDVETQCEVSGESLQRAMDMYDDKQKEEQCAVLMRGDPWFGDPSKGQAAPYSRSGSTEACTAEICQRAEIACQTERDTVGNFRTADSACQTDPQDNTQDNKLKVHFRTGHKSSVRTEPELPLILPEEVAEARTAKEERSASIRGMTSTPLGSRSVVDILRRHGVVDPDTADSADGVVPNGRSPASRRQSVSIKDPATVGSYRPENENPNLAATSLSSLPDLVPRRRHSTSSDLQQGLHIVDLASPSARTPKGPKGAIVRRKTARVSKA